MRPTFLQRAHRFRWLAQIKFILHNIAENRRRKRDLIDAINVAEFLLNCPVNSHADVLSNYRHDRKLESMRAQLNELSVFGWIKRFFGVTLLLIFCLGQANAQDTTATKVDYVNDFAGLLNLGEIDSLKRICADIEKASRAQVVIVTSNDLQPLQSASAYAYDLAKSLQVGHQSANTGLLILVCPGDRITQIAVGSGLEDVLSDGLARDMQTKDLNPFFKKGKWFNGLRTLLLDIKKTIPLETIELAKQKRLDHKKQLDGFLDPVIAFFKVLMYIAIAAALIWIIRPIINSFLEMREKVGGSYKEYANAIDEFRNIEGAREAFTQLDKLYKRLTSPWQIFPMIFLDDYEKKAVAKMGEHGDLFLHLHKTKADIIAARDWYNNNKGVLRLGSIHFIDLYNNLHNRYGEDFLFSLNDYQEKAFEDLRHLGVKGIDETFLKIDKSHSLAVRELISVASIEKGKGHSLDAKLLLKPFLEYQQELVPFETNLKQAEKELLDYKVKGVLAHRVTTMEQHILKAHVDEREKRDWQNLKEANNLDIDFAAYPLDELERVDKLIKRLVPSESKPKKKKRKESKVPDDYYLTGAFAASSFVGSKNDVDIQKTESPSPTPDGGIDIGGNDSISES